MNTQFGPKLRALGLALLANGAMLAAVAFLFGGPYGARAHATSRFEALAAVTHSTAVMAVAGAAGAGAPTV
jgi:hypothetical protein